jgi:hypothetical protein
MHEPPGLTTRPSIGFSKRPPGRFFFVFGPGVSAAAHVVNEVRLEPTGLPTVRSNLRSGSTMSSQISLRRMNGRLNSEL